MSSAPWWRKAATFLIVSLLAAGAWADPPGRVGRLAEFGGQVWVYDERGGEWIAAVINRPITTGDRLATDRDGRAEVGVGPTVWRLAVNTELEVARLDDSAIVLRLVSGSVAVRVRSRSAARDIEVETGEGRFAPQRAGHYRIDRRDDTSGAAVWNGLLRFSSDDSVLDLEPGRRAEFWRDAGRTHYTWLEGDGRDQFSDWALADDQGEDRSTSTRYVSPEMTGVEDLDRYGRWQGDTEYGPLWVPYTVAPGWAPYRFGHWAWVGPWGWTWIDDAPWGFAPFHYGRWVTFGGRWCWAPGQYVARPVYAPALVAWIGGPHASVSISIGSRPPSVGWFPLGPREVYLPTYRVSPGYIRNVNVTQVRNINATIINQPHTAAQQMTYRNRNVPDAVTVVPSNVVATRQPVSRFFDPQGVREIARGGVTVNAPLVAPPPRREPMMPREGNGTTSRQVMVAPPPSGRARPDVGRSAEAPTVRALNPVPGAPLVRSTVPRDDDTARGAPPQKGGEFVPRQDDAQTPGRGPRREPMSPQLNSAQAPSVAPTLGVTATPATPNPVVRAPVVPTAPATPSPTMRAPAAPAPQQRAPEERGRGAPDDRGSPGTPPGQRVPMSGQPVAPTVQPNAGVMQPAAPVARPSAAAVQPAPPIARPSAAVAQPVPPAARPSAAAVQPAAPPAQPRAAEQQRTLREGTRREANVEAGAEVRTEAKPDAKSEVRATRPSQREAVRVRE